MKVQISKRFAKDTQRIHDTKILVKIRKVLEQANTSQNIFDISGVEAMAGHPGFFRIKIDHHYRIGIHYEDGTVQFLRVGGRGDFYKGFP